MPAAAVIPAPMAYTNAAAVKTLVVGSEAGADRSRLIAVLLTVPVWLDSIPVALS